MRTLTRDEIARHFKFTPELVDALIDSGRVLCHVRNGEARVPIDQLEALFRDSLVRVYQVPAEEPVVPVAELPAEVVEAAEAPVEDEPLTDVVVTPVVPAAEIEERPDQRRAERYVPRRQIDGIFGDAKFTIVQMSATGLRIRHREPLLPGTEAKLSFALMRPARSIVIRARVVWTSLAQAGDERFSISGLRVIEHADRLSRALDTLRTAHELQPERRAHSRRATDSMTVLEGVSDDEIALVTQALQKFANDPVEASRWYSRGRFALSDEAVRRVAPTRAGDRDEILGVWEYLERQVDLEKVASVVSWSRIDRAQA